MSMNGPSKEDLWLGILLGILLGAASAIGFLTLVGMVWGLFV